MTRVATISNVIISLVFCIGVTSCNKEDFYEKEYLDNPYQSNPPTGSVEAGVQGGTDTGDGDIQGGVDDGGIGTTGGTDGTGTTGGTDGTGTTGGTDGSGTTGGTDGTSTTGGTDGTSTGGTVGDCILDYGNDDNAGGPDSICKNEIFHQSSSQSKKIDILWIIDNSGSMSDEQTALGVNFSAFINDFITKDVDFKMAITTTDVSSAAKKGKMVTGSDTKLTSAKADLNEARFKDDFKNLVKVGTSGSGNEKGLEASEGFMEKYAASFIRPDAYLAVVVLSDEEDQSSKAVSYYTNLLKSYKAEEGLVKVYSIVDTNSTNHGSGITTGFQRYAAASNQTAGTVSNIRNNFHTSLSAMGDSIINLLDSFALAHNPVDGTLKVYVNGIETSDYTFDAASRSIKFDVTHLPPVGAEISVYYEKQ